MAHGVGHVLVSTIALAVSAMSSAANAPALQYAVAGRIAGPRDAVAWDYATIDDRTGQLFVSTLESRTGASYTGEITAFDLRSARVTGNLVKDTMPHKVVLLNRGLAAAADAASNSVIFFKEKTGTIVARIKTSEPASAGGWHDPDSLLYEPGTGLLVAVNHDSGSLSLVNVARRTVVGHIRIGGILEEAAAGGSGTILVNVSSKGEIAVVSVPGRRIVRELRMKGCRESTGIAYDSVDHLVMSVCSNGLAKFVDPENGAELASIRVGKGADGIMYDPRRRVAFIAGGESGTLSIIRIEGRHAIGVTQTLRIPLGTRLGAVDLASGKVYLPSAQYDLSGSRMHLPGLPPLPRVAPGTFGLLVVAPVGAI